MEHWQLLLIAGTLFLIVEILTPVVFFLNFSIACFVTAAVALSIVDWNVLIPVFLAFSVIFLIFLRPLLIRVRTNAQKTGVEGKYIGNIAKVVETVTAHSGVVSIYDERWTARSVNGEEIAVGEEVKIVKNESLLLYVEKKV